jgi:DNA-binding winged helix-turn-helix (wHTH) protein
VYEFAGIKLDSLRRTLTDTQGVSIEVPPRAFDVLLLLVQHHGQLLEKALLMKAAWPKVFVADNSLDQLVSQLRRALGSVTDATLIVTERGRGFRFTAPVVVHEQPASQDKSASAAHHSRVPQAQQSYLQARALALRPTPENLTAACELLRRALTLDPDFAHALAYLAMLRTVFVAFDIPMEDALGRAEEEARRALAIDAGLARGHQALGNVLVARGDWSEAEHHFEAACRLEEDPDASVTRIWQLTQSAGYLRLAHQQASEIDELAPSQPLPAIARALAASLLGFDADAQRYADGAAALGWPRTQGSLKDVYFLIAVRAKEYQKAQDCLTENLPAPMGAAGAAQAFHLMRLAFEDNRQCGTAVAALRRLAHGVAPEHLGMTDRKRILLWQTMLGALDNAFDFAHQSLDHFARSGMIGISWGMLWLPEMEPFRADGRFQSIIERLRLMDYWIQRGPPDGYTLQGRSLVHLPASRGPAAT